MLTLRPERFVAGGEALAKADDGRVVFVRGALPGELVSVELTDEKRDWSRGHVVDVLESSADRVTPPCQYRIAGCGGCDWQHVDGVRPAHRQGGDPRRRDAPHRRVERGGDRRGRVGTAVRVSHERARGRRSVGAGRVPP